MGVFFSSYNRPGPGDAAETVVDQYWQCLSSVLVYYNLKQRNKPWGYVFFSLGICVNVSVYIFGLVV